MKKRESVMTIYYCFLCERNLRSRYEAEAHRGSGHEVDTIRLKISTRKNGTEHQYVSQWIRSDS